MAKGASIKFKSYEETIPHLLTMLNLGKELKKYDKIILKPFIRSEENYTPVEFTEQVLKFCLENKNPVAEVFIAEGADGYDTMESFANLGYKTLAEKYSIGLIDLNDTETEEIQDGYFLKFEKINYPKILLESFIITLPKLAADEEFNFTSSLASMLNAFPASHYKGFFSKNKNKIRKFPIKYSIHDILRCKMPDFSVVDASEHGQILAGIPLEIDKQSAKFLNLSWRAVPHMRLVDENFLQEEEKDILNQQG